MFGSSVHHGNSQTSESGGTGVLPELFGKLKLVKILSPVNLVKKVSSLSPLVGANREVSSAFHMRDSRDRL